MFGGAKRSANVYPRHRREQMTNDGTLSSPRTQGLAAKRVFEEALGYRRRTGPFIKWHLKTKFQVTEQLFNRHLKADCRFVDMGCGTGDALLLASLCQPQSELWGLDIYPPDLEIAHRRVPSARLAVGDMRNPSALPKGYFDIVHEFGAAYLVPEWGALLKNYFSLLRDDGILLWELPEKVEYRARFLFAFPLRQRYERRHEIKANPSKFLATQIFF